MEQFNIQGSNSRLAKSASTCQNKQTLGVPMTQGVELFNKEREQSWLLGGEVANQKSATLPS